MQFILKIIIWLIAFPIALIVLSVLTVIEYAVMVFDMPIDIWHHMNDDYDETTDT
jgi:hypothetical protein